MPILKPYKRTSKGTIGESSVVLPVRVVLAPQDTTQITNVDADIPAQSSIGKTAVYVIPSGYMLYLSSVDVSCEVNLRSRLLVYEDDTLRWDRYFWGELQLIDSDIGIIPKDEGVILYLDITNNDTVTRNYKGAIWGTLMEKE